MALSPVAERRLLTYLPPLLVAALLIPFAVRQNAWYEWENAYWYLQRQAAHVSAHGTPTFFLHTKDGSFYPFFLFYGGFTLGLLAYPAALFGAWPVFLASMVAAVVGGYLGIWWTARLLGLSHRLAVLPALIYVTTPYVLSDAYGRGAWAELVGVNAVPVMLAGWTSLLRPGRRRWPAWAAIAGATAIVAGTHNITLLVSAVVVPPLVLALTPLVVGAERRAEVLAPVRGGLLATALGAGLTGAWLLPNLWLGGSTDIAASSLSREMLAQGAPFDRLANVLSPWPVVPEPFAGHMWIYAQAPVLAICWALVAAGLLLLAGGRGARGRLVACGALLALGTALLLLVLEPSWWLSFPRLVQAVQLPIRLIPYLAIVVAVAVAVLAGGLARGRRVLLGALVAVVAVQSAAAIHVVTSGRAAVALTATPQRRGDITAAGEPSPFSGPGEIVARQFRVLHRPRGEQRTVGAVRAEVGDPLTADAAVLRGTARAGDRLVSDVIASPLVRIGGDARAAGRTSDGRVLLEVVRTGPDGRWRATARGQCALCLTAVGDRASWQLLVGRLLTLVSLAVLAALPVVALRRRLPPRRDRAGTRVEERVPEEADAVGV